MTTNTPLLSYEKNLNEIVFEQKSKPFSNEINKTYQLQYINPIKKQEMQITCFCLFICNRGPENFCLFF